MKNIMIIDTKMYSRNRIKELVSEYDVNVYEAENSFQVFNILKKLNNKIELIITDINLGKENGIDIIRKINKKEIQIPILILTSENKRKTFIEGIKAGATDYILQPFDAKVLLKRILKGMKTDNDENKVIKKSKADSIHEENSVDFNEYLEKESKIAENESKKFSVLMLTLFKSVDEFTEKVEKEYASLTNTIYPKIKELLSGSDLFIKYGYQSFIASFKNIENKEEIIDNINKIFQDAKKENIMYKEYFLEWAFVDFPEDGKNKDELLRKLQDKIVEKINNIKNMEK